MKKSNDKDDKAYSKKMAKMEKGGKKGSSKGSNPFKNALASVKK